MSYERKPGTALRATAAFVLLNLPLVGTAAFTYWMGGGMGAEWWLRAVLAVAVAGSELAIVTTTIGPPLLDWIKSEEYIDRSRGDRPTWEKGK